MTEDLGGIHGPSWVFSGTITALLCEIPTEGQGKTLLRNSASTADFVLWADNSCNIWVIWEWLSARPDRGLLGPFYDM